MAPFKNTVCSSLEDLYLFRSDETAISGVWDAYRCCPTQHNTV